MSTPETPNKNNASTTLYRLDRLEQRQENIFNILQSKLEEIAKAVTSLSIEQQHSESSFENYNDQIKSINMKLDSLQKEIAALNLLHATELAKIKTTMSVTEKYAPGAFSGAGAAAVVTALIEIILKLVGN